MAVGGGISIFFTVGALASAVIYFIRGTVAGFCSATSTTTVGAGAGRTYAGIGCTAAIGGFCPVAESPANIGTGLADADIGGTAAIGVFCSVTSTTTAVGSALPTQTGLGTAGRTTAFCTVTIITTIITGRTYAGIGGTAAAWVISAVTWSSTTVGPAICATTCTLHTVRVL